MKYVGILAVLLCAQFSSAMQPQENAQAHEIQQQIQERMSKFLDAHKEHVLVAPEELNPVVSDWLATNKHLVNDATNPQFCTQDDEPSMLRKFYCAKKMCDKQLCNKSTWAFALPIEVKGKKYLIRLPGPVHYADNINAQVGMPWNSKVSQATYQQFTQTYGDKFYQNVSRYVYSVVARKTIATLKLEYCTAPASYLVKIPGKDDAVCDQHYVVVEEFLDQSKALGDPSVASTLKLQEVTELYKLMSAGIWDLASDGSNIRKTVDGKFAWVDTEQPDSTGITEFLNVPLWRHVHNTFSGAEGLHTLLLKHNNSECADYIKKQAKQDLLVCTHNENIKDQLVAQKLQEEFARRYSVSDKTEEQQTFIHNQEQVFLQNRLSGYFYNLK